MTKTSRKVTQLQYNIKPASYSLAGLYPIQCLSDILMYELCRMLEISLKNCNWLNFASPKVVSRKNLF